MNNNAISDVYQFQLNVSPFIGSVSSCNFFFRFNKIALCSNLFLKNFILSMHCLFYLSRVFFLDFNVFFCFSGSSSSWWGCNMAALGQQTTGAPRSSNGGTNCANSLSSVYFMCTFVHSTSRFYWFIVLFLFFVELHSTKGMYEICLKIHYILIYVQFAGYDFGRMIKWWCHRLSSSSWQWNSCGRKIENWQRSWEERPNPAWKCCESRRTNWNRG